MPETSVKQACSSEQNQRELVRLHPLRLGVRRGGFGSSTHTRSNLLAAHCRPQIRREISAYGVRPLSHLLDDVCSKCERGLTPYALLAEGGEAVQEELDGAAKG